MILLAFAAGLMTTADCKGIQTCASAVRDLHAAERPMNLEFQGAIKRLRTCKPVNSTRCYNMPRAIKLVDTEQRTWLAWRDAHCDVFMFSMEGTSAEGELRAVCRTDLTRKRTGKLKKIGRG